VKEGGGAENKGGRKGRERMKALGRERRRD